MAIHAMIDLETLSTEPNAIIISIGAVAFTVGEMSENTFYTNVDREDCQKLGLHKSESTVKWWDEQSQEAREATQKDAVPLLDALKALCNWLREENVTHLWGNGADFDNPILKSSFTAIDAEMPIKPYNGRCYRTVKSMPQAPAMSVRIGTHHNALDDAMSQALHLIDIDQFFRNKHGVAIIE